MKKTPTPEQWMEEFHEFMGTNSIPPPRNLSDSILNRVSSDLNPSAFKVFYKLLGIHAVVGTLTLLFCPQFGFSFFSDMGLMGLFMPFGMNVCMAACGAVFMGGSLLTASLILRPEEVLAIRRTEILQVALLALLSVGVFVFLGSQVAIGLALFWLLGSVLGGLGTLELGWAFRRWLIVTR